MCLQRYQQFMKHSHSPTFPRSFMHSVKNFQTFFSVGEYICRTNLTPGMWTTSLLWASIHRIVTGVEEETQQSKLAPVELLSSRTAGGSRTKRGPRNSSKDTASTPPTVSTDQSKRRTFTQSQLDPFNLDPTFTESTDLVLIKVTAIHGFSTCSRTSKRFGTSGSFNPTRPKMGKYLNWRGCSLPNRVCGF